MDIVSVCVAVVDGAWLGLHTKRCVACVGRESAWASEGLQATDLKLGLGRRSFTTTTVRVSVCSSVAVMVYW